MTGKRITVITNATDLLPNHYPERIHRVKSVRKYFPRDLAEGRKRALVAFFDAETGGQFTVRAADIIKIQ